MHDDQEKADTKMHLVRLQIEHDDYHTAIDAMTKLNCDPLKIQRMKKKKLALKDRIERVASAVIPDIIA